jgi:hypothetical protein
MGTKYYKKNPVMRYLKKYLNRPVKMVGSDIRFP